MSMESLFLLICRKNPHDSISQNHDRLVRSCYRYHDCIKPVLYPGLDCYLNNDGSDQMLELIFEKDIRNVLAFLDFRPLFNEIDQTQFARRHRIFCNFHEILSHLNCGNDCISVLNFIPEIVLSSNYMPDKSLIKYSSVDVFASRHTVKFIRNISMYIESNPDVKPMSIFEPYSPDEERRCYHLSLVYKFPNGGYCFHHVKKTSYEIFSSFIAFRDYRKGYYGAFLSPTGTLLITKVSVF